jgi:hypothetical protein
MYIEQLTTPNPIRYPNEPTMPLIDACGLADAENIRHRITSTTDPWQATIEIIESLRGPIRRSLRYPETEEDWGDDPTQSALDLLVQPGQQTNCYGYTMIGSEALSCAGIEHYIIYGRGHGALFVPQRSTYDSRMHMVDFLFSEFNADITNDLAYSLQGRPPKGARHIPARLESALTDEPKYQQNIILHSDTIAANMGKKPEELAEAWPYFWGDPKGNQYDESRDSISTATDRRKQRQLQWILSVYTPQTGRSMLEKLAKFEVALGAGETALAATQIIALDGIYPENDCRYSHPEIKALIGKMCLAADYDPDTTYSTIEAYCNSIRTGDPRVFGLKGDLYRRIANVKTDDKEAVARAFKAYAAAESSVSNGNWSRQKEAYAGKANKMKARI